MLLKELFPLLVRKAQMVEPFHLLAQVGDELRLGGDVDIFVALLHQLLDEAGFQCRFALVAIVLARQRLVVGHHRAMLLFRYDVEVLHNRIMSCKDRYFSLFVLEKITLVDSFAIILDEIAVLICKRCSSMVFLLPHDVTNNLVFVTIAVAEARILAAPATEIWKVRVFLQPLAAIRLHPLHKRCQRQVRWQRHKNVDMVRHSTNAIGLATKVFCNTIDVGIQFPLMLKGDGGFAAIGAEYDVIV